MKKFLSVLLVLVMVFAAISLVACNKKGDGSTENGGEESTGGASGPIETRTHDFGFFSIEVPTSLGLVDSDENSATYMNYMTGESFSVSISEYPVYPDGSFDNKLPKTKEEAAEELINAHNQIISNNVMSDVEVVTLNEKECKILFKLTNNVSGTPIVCYVTQYTVNYKMAAPEPGKSVVKTISIIISESDPSRPVAAISIPDLTN